MNKRFSFSKVLSLLVILLTAFVLIGCKPSNVDQETVDAALANVGVTYGTGDTALTVTKNLTLPAAVGEVTITWASGNTAVISNTGVVTRQTADTNVTLTATLTLGEATATKDFVLKVLAAPVVIDVEAALNAIVITYATGDTASTVTQNITLPTTIVQQSTTLNITWTSSNTDVLTAAGVVTRPVYGESNSAAVLTATINSEEKQFLITVLAITEKPVSLILEEARTGLLLAGISNGVAADLTLPATAGSEGVTVTWESDTPEVLSNAGVVSRQVDNTTVVLTATLHYPDSDLTLTKDFEIIVLAFAEYTVVTNIAEALTLPELSYVKILGVTVVGRTLDGFMFADASANMFAYTGSEPSASIIVGNVYDFYGMTDFYFSPWQINGTADANKPIVVKPSTAAVTELTPTPVTSITALIASLGTTFTAEAPLEYTYVEITARVRVQSETDNYSTIIVDSDYAGGDIDTAAQSAFKDNALVVYYKSNKAAFYPVDGLVVTFNAFVYSLRSDRNVFTIIFVGTADDIEVLPMSDVESVDAAKTSILATTPLQQVENATLTLPTELYGATIVWASNNEAVINPTTGVVTRVEGAQTMVTLTATITKGVETVVQEIVVKVGEIPLSTIAVIIEAAISTTVFRTTGVVTSSEYQNTFFIQDATGGIALYTGSQTGTSANDTLLIDALGKEVEIIGTRTAYNGMRQIAVTEIKVLATSTVPAAVDVDAVALNAVDMLPYQGKLVSMTQLLVLTKATDSYGNVTVTFEQASSGKTIAMKWDSRVVLSAEATALLAGVAVGEAFNITNPLAWNNNPYLYFTSSTILTDATLTDANKANVDANDIVVPATVSVDSTLTLPLTGLQGSAIVWASNNDAIINPTTGVVTVPASGQVTVTLTATLTLGTATVEKTFEVIVGLTDLQKATADADELAIPGTWLDAAPMTTLMPALGTKGSTITWATSNATIITTAGTVTLPTVGQETVTLTATVTMGTETVVREFIVVVGASTTPTVLTATAVYVGLTTTNMVVSVNNAVVVSLDPAIFSVTATNGAASALVGLNAAGQIRLYGERASGNGNTLTVTAAAGYTIKSVSFTFGTSTNSPAGVLTLGTTPTNLVTADLLNVVRTYEALSIQSFSLQNTATGGTSNAQIYILSIAITYIAN